MYSITKRNGGLVTIYSFRQWFILKNRLERDIPANAGESNQVDLFKFLLFVNLGENFNSNIIFQISHTSFKTLKRIDLCKFFSYVGFNNIISLEQVQFINAPNI